LAHNITKKRDLNDCSFVHLTLVLLLHFLVKCRSRRLAVYNTEFILGSACCLNFYWNPFTFDWQGAKNKLAQFFLRHGVVHCFITLQPLDFYTQ